VPDGNLNNLQTTIPGFLFSQAVFNLDATANGSATINAFDQAGTQFSFLLPLSGSGQNFFTLTGTGGELISRVAFTSTVGLDDVSQIRFGQLTPVPIPAVDCRACYWYWRAAAFLAGGDADGNPLDLTTKRKSYRAPLESVRRMARHSDPNLEPSLLQLGAAKWLSRLRR
jgi:hypothetical protein